MKMKGFGAPVRSTASRSDPSGTCLDEPSGIPFGQFRLSSCASPRCVPAAPSMFRSGSPLSPLPPQPGDLPPLERRSTPSRRRSLRSRGLHMRVRGPAELAESIETERFKKSRGPLLSAREAGPRTKLQARRRWSEGVEGPKTQTPSAAVRRLAPEERAAGGIS